MAVKERSQIKGTDAQIKAFAGHNGVLAFATDTKSLHVLSGTAGTTTEFLPSNKVATKTELDGKLSTSGGTVNGSITVDGGNYRGLIRGAGVNDFEIIGADNDGCLVLSPGSLPTFSAKKSASLYLSTTDYTGHSVQVGSFYLSAMDATTGAKTLFGSPAGSLTWDGHEVARVVSSGKSANGNQWYRKYNDGYIEQAGLFDNGSDARGVDTTITFLAPFSSSVYSVQVTPGTANTTAWDGNVIAKDLTTTSMYIGFWGNAEHVRARYLYWFACGY